MKERLPQAEQPKNVQETLKELDECFKELKIAREIFESSRIQLEAIAKEDGALDDPKFKLTEEHLAAQLRALDDMERELEMDRATVMAFLLSPEKKHDA